MGVRAKAFVPPPRPDNWEEMPYKEKRRWIMRNVSQPQRYKRKSEHIDSHILQRLRKIKTLKKSRWDETRLNAWLRAMTDKQIMGFSMMAVERLNDLVREMIILKSFKTTKITNVVKQEMKKTMDMMRHELRNQVSRMTGKYVKFTSHYGDQITGNYKKLYKKITPTTFEKDGVVYQNISFLLERDKYLKFKAVLAIEQKSFPDWIDERIGKYVSMKFRRLGEIHDLVDPVLDRQIPDEEMKGDDDDANLETESKRQEKEVNNQSLKPSQDNLSPGGS
jgi:hypothetical protein